ncbi:efflux RND transporter periplasmic adaptor subunit [Archangium lipolyticum]|uniref:efflux RND transporter periplasmic adaptor subunit n=1 Tax=Archangium lipolyticum TaxID=2970465 RepID=UPI002149D808|nr:efflux RND transporter periplasmic adaptor subunit [Archangium lipolyticum]
MAQRLFLAGMGLVLAFGLALLLVSRAPAHRASSPSATPNAPQGQPPSVASEGAGFVGVIVADNSVDVSARFEGVLESVEVRVGDLVRKGGVLARQDVRSVQHELSITQASLQAARAEEEVARLTLTSAQETLQRGGDPKLVNMGAISEEEQAKLRYAEKMAAAKLSAAQAQVRNQEARVEQLQLRVSEATIRAPFDARVSMRYVDPGALVSAGRPIVHLLREGPQVVRFAIPEDAAPGVSVGTPVRIGVRGRELRLRGRVENVAPEVDAASRMVLAIASVAQEEGAQLPFGSVVQVSVEQGAWVGQHPGQ